MFKPKNKQIETEEDDTDEMEEMEEEEAPQVKPQQKKKDILSKMEIADIIEGNLNRALHLLQFLRN